MKIIYKVMPLILYILSCFIYGFLILVVARAVYGFGRSQLANLIFLLVPITTITICTFIGNRLSRRLYSRLVWILMGIFTFILTLITVTFFFISFDEFSFNFIVSIGYIYDMLFPLFNALFILLGYFISKRIAKNQEVSKNKCS